jgi:hypothetical protein
MVLPVTVRQSPCSRPASSSIFISGWVPPMRDSSDITYLPLGLRSASTGTCFADAGEVVERQLHPGGVGHGEQVQHGVGGAAEGDDHRDGVLEGLAGHDVARADAALDQVQHGGAGPFGSRGFSSETAAWAELLGRLMPSASMALRPWCWRCTCRRRSRGRGWRTSRCRQLLVAELARGARRPPRTRRRCRRPCP